VQNLYRIQTDSRGVAGAPDVNVRRKMIVGEDRHLVPALAEEVGDI
jgi:hypothetical protein